MGLTEYPWACHFWPLLCARLLSTIFITLPSHGRRPKLGELADRTTQLANDQARICIQVTDSSGVFAWGALCKESAGEPDLCNSQSEKTFWRQWFLKALARQSLPATQQSEECAWPVGENCRLLCLDGSVSLWPSTLLQHSFLGAFGFINMMCLHNCLLSDSHQW